MGKKKARQTKKLSLPLPSIQVARPQKQFGIRTTQPSSGFL